MVSPGYVLTVLACSPCIISQYLSANICICINVCTIGIQPFVYKISFHLILESWEKRLHKICDAVYSTLVKWLLKTPDLGKVSQKKSQLSKLNTHSLLWWDCYLCTKCVSMLKEFRPVEGYHKLSHKLILYSPQTRNIFSEKKRDLTRTDKKVKNAKKVSSPLRKKGGNDVSC